MGTWLLWHTPWGLAAAVATRARRRASFADIVLLKKFSLLCSRRNLASYWTHEVWDTRDSKSYSFLCDQLDWIAVTLPDRFFYVKKMFLLKYATKSCYNALYGIRLLDILNYVRILKTILNKFVFRWVTRSVRLYFFTKRTCRNVGHHDLVLLLR